MRTALPLKESFISMVSKFFHHQEAMKNLRNGRGQPITTHVMATDICNHKCAFCSVQARAGDTLPLKDILAYLDILLRFGLKSVILSGGGNPILYKCPEEGYDFNVLVDEIHSRDLEIGVITNGMPMKGYEEDTWNDVLPPIMRRSWKTVRPETLDKLTWIRISMSGLDHPENAVYVPDVDPEKTTLGFSYVLHDIYTEPADPHHGQVSRPEDFLTLGTERLHDHRIKPPRYGADRIPVLTDQIGEIVRKHHPKYVRLLPNCLQPAMIPERCDLLQKMADAIDPDVVFVQYKPPAAPNACYLGYIHPVLNCDGFVYPCDSCVLNEEAGHQFGESWRVCHWSKVASIYEQPVRSLIGDPKKQCPGCVFHGSNLLLEGVVNGTADITPPVEVPSHPNFV